METPAVPKFKVNDIVYMLPHRTDRYAVYYIGSAQEIDFKVIAAGNTSRLGEFTCDLLCGDGSNYTQVSEKYLVKASEYLIHSGAKRLELLEDTELAPEGTIFYTMGPYIMNTERTIFIHKERLAEINHLFK